jgi:hypothetical protein
MRELTCSEQRAVEQLHTAFKGVKHGLWTGGRINAAPTRHAEIEKLRQKSEGAWLPHEIDWLYFKAATTVGDDETVKYVFVRFVEILLRDEIVGPASGPIIVSKLDYAHFETWPEAQRKAALGALTALEAYWASGKHWDQETLTELNDFIARHNHN